MKCVGSSGQEVVHDPLKSFGEACRDELKSIHSIHGDSVTAHFLKASNKEVTPTWNDLHQATARK